MLSKEQSHRVLESLQFFALIDNLEKKADTNYQDLKEGIRNIRQESRSNLGNDIMGMINGNSEKHENA